MNVGRPGSPRTRPILAFAAVACLGAGVPLLAAGCSAAPAGATNNSPAIGPTGPATPSRFPPFQVPATWSGYRNTVYRQIQKSVTGTKPRNLHITAGPDLVFWLACLGTGRAKLKSPSLGLNWSIKCGTRFDPQSINFSPTTGINTGRKVLVWVAATPGSRWEVRVDAPVPAA
jgi:hypothetical protein